MARGGRGEGDRDVLVSRWWAVFCLLGIAAWVGVTLFVGLQQEPGSDSKAASRAFAISGGVFFLAMFVAAGVGMRRSQSRTNHDLYERLAITPVPRSAVRRATRGAHTIGYVYLAFGVIVTFVPLVAIGIDDDELTSTLLAITIGIVVIWAIYSVWAIRRVYTTTDVLFEPLGLKLIATPKYVGRLFTDSGELVGAMTYAGQRHGRSVTITHGVRDAATIVGGPTRIEKVPKSPVEMMRLTGEGPRCWKGAIVAVDEEAVAVVRHGNGVGKWFLHDLLLAETLATGEA